MRVNKFTNRKPKIDKHITYGCGSFEDRKLKVNKQCSKYHKGHHLLWESNGDFVNEIVYYEHWILGNNEINSFEVRRESK